MVLDLNPVTVWNLIFTSAIFVLGMVGYQKTKSRTSFFIGLAFGLYAISHVVTLLGYAQSLELFLLTIRTFAYVAVIYALLCIAFIPCRTSA
jgi:uncharacterized membrane protein (UPF0136 family)